MVIFFLFIFIKSNNLNNINTNNNIIIINNNFSFNKQQFIKNFFFYNLKFFIISILNYGYCSKYKLLLKFTFKKILYIYFLNILILFLESLKSNNYKFINFFYLFLVIFTLFYKFNFKDNRKSIMNYKSNIDFLNKYFELNNLKFKKIDKLNDIDNIILLNDDINMNQIYSLMHENISDNLNINYIHFYDSLEYGIDNNINFIKKVNGNITDNFFLILNDLDKEDILKIKIIFNKIKNKKELSDQEKLQIINLKNKYKYYLKKIRQQFEKAFINYLNNPNFDVEKYFDFFFYIYTFYLEKNFKKINNLKIELNNMFNKFNNLETLEQQIELLSNILNFLEQNSLLHKLNILNHEELYYYSESIIENLFNILEKIEQNNQLSEYKKEIIGILKNNKIKIKSPLENYNLFIYCFNIIKSDNV